MASIRIKNCTAVSLSDVPLVGLGEWLKTVLEGIGGGSMLSALFAVPTDGRFRVFAVLSSGATGSIEATSTLISHSYPSLTSDCPSAHMFERELYEQWGIEAEGHPWLKPVRFEPARDGGYAPTIGITGYFSMEGCQVHEVGVGPVHAGVIEPGHFRFQCHGETVHHLEIMLGYQHRGIERALRGGPDARTIHYMETAAGDTTIGNATAYCTAIESLSGIVPDAGSEVVRAVALELERMANHAGDLGALAGDVAFLPTANYCGRIRGDILNTTALLCGNRFGRGLVIPGGICKTPDATTIREIVQRLESVESDLESALTLMFESPSVQARFEHTGEVPGPIALSIGLVGPAARACGIHRDIRSDLPWGVWKTLDHKPTVFHGCDCLARSMVRRAEIADSIAIIRKLLERELSETHEPGGAPEPDFCTGRRLTPDSFAVSIVEGWRGEICHVALTGSDGRFAAYKIVDPSFHNWFGLAMALRNQQISDFPLCNKSFNLSYCGHDL